MFKGKIKAFERFLFNVFLRVVKIYRIFLIFLIFNNENYAIKNFLITVHKACGGGGKCGW